MKRLSSQFYTILLFCISIISAPGQTTIKIGLLIQNSASTEAKNGAELAILRENLKGGFEGRKFALVVKSMEGPWGTGSSQAVDMIFRDEVVAIIGSHDGRNAHLVEQATTKSHITFLSAWAGDPTLSQAFTPWFFNCVPNSNQQAEILAREMNNKKFNKITLVINDDYDAASAYKSFMLKSQQLHTVEPVTIVADKSDRDFSEVTELLISMKPENLILFTSPDAADRIISNLEKQHLNIPFFGPLSLLTENSPVYNHKAILENILLLSAGSWFQYEKSDFAVLYRKTYGTWPGAQAAYSYDAMTAMIMAVKNAGADKEIIQKALMGIIFTGVTGKIKFDEKGNRIFTY